MSREPRPGGEAEWGRRLNEAFGLLGVPVAVSATPPDAPDGTVWIAP